ncbi:MAG: methyltransferase domain-containing protein [Prochlorococcus marinus CUG1438]|nr:methyltransferase domain-containing protein [Prochlorococcus marinus CUG1438]
MKKKIILGLARFVSLFWKCIPFTIREFLFTSFFIIESRGNNANEGLKRIFLIQDKLNWVINERAIKYDNGIHPKHRLTGYHDFFIDRINDGESVLDVGCGIGVVAMDIASQRNKSLIIGVDIDKENIEIARKLKIKNSINNINFICGDINSKKDIKSDVVILSNILEHISDRVTFMEDIIKKSGAKKFLIRVPLFERDWQIALRKELEIYYYSDKDHKIEHSIEEFKKEINSCDLKIKELQTIWGEIWAHCFYEQ